MKFFLGILCTLFALILLKLLIESAEEKIAFQYDGIINSVILESVNENVITPEQANTLKKKMFKVTNNTEFE